MMEHRKRLGDPRWIDDADMKAFQGFMAQYMAGTDPHDALAAHGDDVTNATHQVLQQAGLSFDGKTFQPTGELTGA